MHSHTGKQCFTVFEKFRLADVHESLSLSKKSFFLKCPTLIFDLLLALGLKLKPTLIMATDALLAVAIIAVRGVKNNTVNI
jgi:hypothetical protein